MPITRTQVINVLMPDEPDYTKAAQLGKEAIPHLKALIAEQDEAVASKATYLLGLIKAPEVADVLIEAASSRSNVVRVAAAATARHLKPADASKLLSILAQDASHGVRIMVLKSFPDAPSADLVERIRRIATDDPERQLRQRASDILRKLPPNP